MNSKRILNPVSMFVFGLVLGTVSRILDIFTENLGEIFSQMAVWILIGVIIAIYSRTKKKAMVNVLLFCIGMLITYYVTAVITKGVYGQSYIIGWTVFALCSPIFAYFTWMTKEPGVLPKIISVCIVAVSVLSSVIMFDGFRLYDVVIDGALIYFSFIKKIHRKNRRQMQ